MHNKTGTKTYLVHVNVVLSGTVEVLADDEDHAQEFVESLAIDELQDEEGVFVSFDICGVKERKP